MKSHNKQDQNLKSWEKYKETQKQQLFSVIRIKHNVEQVCKDEFKSFTTDLFQFEFVWWTNWNRCHIPFGWICALELQEKILLSSKTYLST